MPIYEHTSTTATSFSNPLASPEISYTTDSGEAIRVEKSTVRARTGFELRSALNAYSRNSGMTFRVVSNPEFLREGTAVEDFLHPDRIVLGARKTSPSPLRSAIYRPILERTFAVRSTKARVPRLPKAPLLVTTINCAELIKHASNSFLALKNQLCQRHRRPLRKNWRGRRGSNPRHGARAPYRGNSSAPAWASAASASRKISRSSCIWPELSAGDSRVAFRARESFTRCTISVSASSRAF